MMVDRTEPATVESFQVYVGGLDEHVPKEQLHSEFGRFGAVKSVWLAYNPPGFGFVRFYQKQDAEQACLALNNSVMFGHKIRVEMSDMRGKGGAGGGERGRGRGGERGRGRGQPYYDANSREPPRYGDYTPTRGYSSGRSRGFRNGGYAERDYRPAESNAYSDREYREIRGDSNGYRDRPVREYRPDSGEYRDREYRPAREQTNGYRDREYRPESNGFRDGGYKPADAYRAREYNPPRENDDVYRDGGYKPADTYRAREYNLPRENDDGYRDRGYKPAEGNGYREADRFTPPRDYRTSRDHEDRDFRTRNGRDRSRDGDYRDRERLSSRGARDRRSSPVAYRSRSRGDYRAARSRSRSRGDYRAVRSRSPRNRSRSPFESRESVRDRSWENYREGPQNSSRTKY
ncbi:hypothetical protein LSTR_LSTR001171 [Laodelphax striatellus]|uniref:RRM domain-containing protein n=1 Tax=Laodelphax striatellus TaxID=195883 RepID=A0A482X2P3_LAOST|nr:hypothetical protein LSTR_LSTR001171 [Laodelphax striatellus]